MRKHQTVGLRLLSCIGLYWGMVVPAFAESLSLNGFATIGAAYSGSKKGFRYGDNKQINFRRDSKLGLNLNGTVNDQLYAAGQFITRLDDIDGRASLKSDWAFINYEPVKAFSFRMGRIKLPVTLANDYLDVGQAYLWAEPPTAVYESFPLKSLDGISVGGMIPVASLSLNYDMWSGSIDKDFGQNIVITGSKLAGLRLSLGNDMLKGGFAYNSSLWTLKEFQWQDYKVKTSSVFVEANIKKFRFVSEMIQSKDEGFNQSKLDALESQMATLQKQAGLLAAAGQAIPKALTDGMTAIGQGIAFARTKIDATAMYATFAYNLMDDTLIPYFTYSSSKTYTYPIFGNNNHSLALGTQYQISPTASLKMQATQVALDSGNFGISTSWPATAFATSTDGLESKTMYYQSSINLIF